MTATVSNCARSARQIGALVPLGYQSGSVERSRPASCVYATAATDYTFNVVANTTMAASSVLNTGITCNQRNKSGPT